MIFRIGFGISILFGGIGALAYLLLAAFVPTDGEPDRAQRLGGRLQSLGFWRGAGMVALVALALAGLLGLAGGAAFAVALGWGVPVAIFVIAIGALLGIAALRGGARWLIAPALALALGAGVAAASDLDFRGGIGKREYHPLSIRAIPADGYRLGIGRLDVDLRDLTWGKRRVVRLKVELGAGQASVYVPSSVCVSGPTHVGAGESEVAGELSDGLDVDHSSGRGHGIDPAARDRRERPARAAAGHQQRQREHRERRIWAGPPARGHRAAARGGGEGVRDPVKPDPVSLTSGAAIAAIGALVLLDAGGALDVSLGWMAVALTAAAGLILLVSGLDRDGHGDGS